MGNSTVFTKTFELFTDYHDFVILNTRPRKLRNKGLSNY